MQYLRALVSAPLLARDAVTKAQLTLALNLTTPVGADQSLGLPPGIPGRPDRPRLVHAKTIKLRPLHLPEGRAALIHSIAHIELNAIDLALDIVLRFPGMPDTFYTEWVRIAQEEAKHFMLLRNHLQSYGFAYGDFDAHNTLWDMAQRTQDDLLARLALVPRTLEARGLDASPAVKNKLVSAGDHKAGEILDLILEEEIGHVAAGNRWYRYLCAQRGLDPIATYAMLTQRYSAPALKAPFNLPARRLAGFEEAELHALQTGGH